MIKVRSVLKFLFESNGVKKLRAQVPEAASELSWPSLAANELELVSVQENQDKREKRILILGVINIHWGNWLFSKSS
jgi:hypothetical protein